MALQGGHRPGFLGVLGTWIFRPLSLILGWLGFRRPLALTYNSIKVFVKINDGSQMITVPMDLPKDWTVGQVKDCLVKLLI
jgi:hypothetical protein